MARKKHFISPIDPRIHFLLFLIMALILVVFVGAVLQDTSSDARAFLFCPKKAADQLAQIRACQPYGYKLSKDANGCDAVICESPALVPSTAQ